MNMSVESYTESRLQFQACKGGGKGREEKTIDRLIIQVGHNGTGTQDNSLSTGGVTGMITW